MGWRWLCRRGLGSEPGRVIHLREDQSRAVADVRAAMREHQAVVLRAPTGFGKTYVASYIAHSALGKRKKIILGVHRIELLKQTSKTFTRWGIPHSFIAAGMPSNPFAYVQIASAETLKRRRDLLDCDLLIPDECRLWATPARASMIEEAKAHGAKILGLDATPERMDGKGLAPTFDHMVDGPSVEWLMERGFLSEYRAFAPAHPDMTGLRSVGGEYSTPDLEERFNKPSLIGDAIATHKKYASGLRTMVFAFSRKHGRDVCDAYNRAGIRSVYIDGTTPPDVRTMAIRYFAEGKAEVLVSVNLATEGFDLSSQVDMDVPVEAISLQRPTRSLPLALQMMGRGLRPKDKPAILIDHVNLFQMHGLPDDEREWSLDGIPRKKREAEAVIATMKCMECFGTFRPFKVCPDCGFVMPVSEGRQVEEVAGEIDEVDVEFLRRERKEEVRRARDLPGLVRVARERGYRPGWIVNIMKVRGRPVSYADVERAMRG